MKIAETDFQAWMGGVQSRMEMALARLLPAAQLRPLRLHEAMRYATLEGGKRVRPLLAFAAGEATGAAASRLEIVAAAVEMIHAYSLVHDDLPCMDDDVLRRGKPTCHRAFDEATAVLAGDALQALAFEILATGTDPRRLAMMRTLTQAIGSHGMAGGQAIDLASVGKELTPAAIEDMHRRKTGALIHASVILGAQGAVRVDPPVSNALDGYGRSIGLAFQIVDDLLDVEGETETLGKTKGSDAARGKPTYPLVLGIPAARARVQALYQTALESLKPLGDNGRLLAQLAGYIVERTQ